MKIQIRKRVFETNSSSIHTICIPKEDNTLNIPESIHFGLGEFGWEHEELRTMEERATYLWTGICYVADWSKKLTMDGAKNKIVKYLHKENVQCDFQDPKTAAYYYIDHGYEVVELISMLLSNGKLLKNYLFSNDSFIITGNDNENDEEDLEPKNIKTEDYIIYVKGN